MKWLDYELGSNVYKTTEDAKLWESERGIVDIRKNTLAIPINLEGEEKGYVFHGRGRLLLDTIVETEEGAVGKPIERGLSEQFLMLGEPEDFQRHLDEASQEDLMEWGYNEEEEFLQSAGELFDQFFKKGKMYGRHHVKHHDGRIFAFPNQATDKLDLLVAKGSRIVYTSRDCVFVAQNGNVVLKSPYAVVCSSNGKSVIIDKGRSIIVKKRHHRG